MIHTLKKQSGCFVTDQYSEAGMEVKMLLGYDSGNTGEG